MDALRSILGEDPGEPEAVFYHDWRVDRWSRGAYCYGRVNGAEIRARFSEPVEETLYFAGEACAEGHMGTVHGAMASGLAAAHKIIAAA